MLALALAAMSSLAGCSMLGGKPEPVPVLTGALPGAGPYAPVEPPTDPVVGPAAPATAGQTSPAPAAPVVVLYSAGAPAQARIAERIGAGLAEPAFAVSLIDIDATPTGAPVGAMPEVNARIVAAVGPAALEAARQRFPGAEIVFCHVLSPGRPEAPRSSASTASGARAASSPYALTGAPLPKSAPSDAMDGMHGLAAIPSPALQFAAWSEVDPTLERIGVITSAAFASAIPGARDAAEAIGARLDHRITTSDRETLYLFRRLAPEIDGFWLAPDSSVLSAAVIDEILGIAAEREIGVLVFSEALLARGGLLSVSAPETQVADGVIELIHGIRNGHAHSLPAETPLRAGDVRVNAAVATALGLPAPERLEWVIRDGR